MTFVEFARDGFLFNANNIAAIYPAQNETLWYIKIIIPGGTVRLCPQEYATEEDCIEVIKRISSAIQMRAKTVVIRNSDPVKGVDVVYDFT